MSLLLVVALLSPAFSGEPPCEGPWLRTPAEALDGVASSRECVPHWLDLAYGGDEDRVLDYDPPMDTVGPATLSVAQLQEAHRRFTALQAVDSRFEIVRIIEGIDHMLANRIGFQDVIEGTFPARYDQPMMTVIRGQPLTESALTPHPELRYRAATYRILRNAVYARHGRAFKSSDLQEFFYGSDAGHRFPDMGLSVDPRYADSRLTPTDQANIQLIQRFEQEAKAREALYEQEMAP